MDLFYKDKFNAKDSGLVFSLTIIALLAVVLLLSLMTLSKIFVSIDNKYFYYTSSFLTQAALFFTAFFYCKINKITYSGAISIGKPFDMRHTLFSVLTGLTMIFALTLPAYAFIELLKLLGYEAAPSPVDEITSLTEVALATLFFAVLPAICEEILFRGIILQGLRRFGDTFAVIVSASLFMLMHQNPSQTLFPFMSGIILGYVFLKTGDIKYSMIIHFINNFLSILADYLYHITGAEDTAVFLGLNYIDLALAAAGIIGFVIAMVYFKKVKKEEYANVQPKILKPVNMAYGGYPYGYYNAASGAGYRFGNPPYGNPYSYPPQSGNYQQSQNIAGADTRQNECAADPFTELMQKGYIYNPKNGAFYLENAADVNTEIPPYFSDVSKNARINPYYTAKASFLLYSLFGIVVCVAFWLISFFS